MFLEDGTTEADVECWVRTASVLHSNGDAYDFAVRDGRIVGVRGHAGDRVNHGRLGPKDLFGWQAIGASDRLRTPLVRRAGELVETDWDTAMGRIVERSRELLDQPGGWGRFGFYTSGQLALEDYYTLAVIGKAGIGTPHMDGNTRLCTATAASLAEGQLRDRRPARLVHRRGPLRRHRHLGSQRRRDADDAVGADARPPPRAGPAAPAGGRSASTPVTDEPMSTWRCDRGRTRRSMNGLLREIMVRDWIDHDYVERSRVGWESLVATVDAYPPARVADICDVPVSRLVEAAELLGTSERLLSTVLQGFYQSHQATAAACQVNNLHLIRGMIGRPGAGVLQMNGQPTAQNNRETGANGDLPGFRNWENPDHVDELATLWNVDPGVIPHWAPPTHAMQIWRYAEQGPSSCCGSRPPTRLCRCPTLPASATSSAVTTCSSWCRTSSSPKPPSSPTWCCRRRRGERSSAPSPTPTARSTFSEPAVDPPGEARHDLDILLDYAEPDGLP